MRVIWQTLFPFHYHPVITNDYIDWDYQCQVETAKLYNISIYGDVYEQIKADPLPYLQTDYHLNFLGIVEMIKAIIHEGGLDVA